MLYMNRLPTLAAIDLLDPEMLVVREVVHELAIGFDGRLVDADATLRLQQELGKTAGDVGGEIATAIDETYQVANLNPYEVSLLESGAHLAAHVLARWIRTAVDAQSSEAKKQGSDEHPA